MYNSSLPVQQIPEADAPGQEEWGKIYRVKKLTGLGSSRIYEILVEDPDSGIKTFVLTRPGAKRGARLFELNSVREFMRRRYAEATEKELQNAQ